jgi:hypothetical protein
MILECPHFSDVGREDGGACAIDEHGGAPTVAQCIGCGIRLQLVRLNVKVKRNPPDPRRWPLVARAVYRLRRPGEAGIGDTVERLIRGVKGDTLAAWYERITGAECGCEDKRGRLNERFPYPGGDV